MLFSQASPVFENSEDTPQDRQADEKSDALRSRKCATHATTELFRVAFDRTVRKPNHEKPKVDLSNSSLQTFSRRHPYYPIKKSRTSGDNSR